jgi:hypothetical protein
MDPGDLRDRDGIYRIPEIQDCTKDYIARDDSYLDRSFVLNSISIPILITAQYFIVLPGNTIYPSRTPT